MKMKYGHIIIMAMLMSTACSHDSYESRPDDDVPVVDTRTAISFSGQQGEEQAVSQGTNRANSITRAGTPLSESATSFTVWGYKNMSFSAGSYGDLQTVFPGYVVNWTANSAATTTSNSNGWEYVNQQTSGDEQTIKYWDWNAKAYRYFAVTGTAEDYTAYGTNRANGTEFTMAADATNTGAAPFFSRLWFSTGNSLDYPTKQFGKPVQLEFVKPFARVRFLYKYVYPREGVVLTNQSFKPTEGSEKIALKGTVTVSYPLIGTATKESYSTSAKVNPDEGETLAEFTENADPEDDSKEYTVTDKGWYTVFPNLSQGSYTLSVKVNNQDRTCTVPAAYMSWLPGYSYTYIFKITEEGGVESGWVETAVTNWTDMNADHTVYNW